MQGPTPTAVIRIASGAPQGLSSTSGQPFCLPQGGSIASRPFSAGTDDQEDDFDIPVYYDPPAAFVSRPAPYFQGKGTVSATPTCDFVLCGAIADCVVPTAVVDGEIKDISLDDYRGKFVILFFYPKDWYDYTLSVVGTAQVVVATARVVIALHKHSAQVVTN